MLKLRLTRILWLTSAIVIASSGLAAADMATDGSIRINGTDGGTHAYTKAAATSVRTSVKHCPPGGDMAGLEVSFRNATTDAWTVVHTAGTPWPGTDSDGCTATGDGLPASFDWTLASGSDGVRTVYARFRHGNDALLADDTITLDTQAPTITDDGPTAGPTGSNGWYIAAVTNEFSASDAGSGLANTAQASFSVSSGSDEGNAVLIPSGPVSDVAGNTNGGINGGPFKIDLGNPSVSITSPSDGAETSSSSISVGGTASDAVSGIATVSVNGRADSHSAGSFSDTIALDCGSNTITAVATDEAGRTDSDSITVVRTCVSVTYTAQYKAPIDGYGTMNTAKLGRVVPVKVEILGSDGSEDESGPVSLIGKKIECLSHADSDTVEAYASAGSSNVGNQFRWDPTAGHWIYNLDTGKLAGATSGACYRVDVSRGGSPDSTGKVVGGTKVGEFFIKLTR